jgi:hypothetical protein
MQAYSADLAILRNRTFKVNQVYYKKFEYLASALRSSYIDNPDALVEHCRASMNIVRGGAGPAATNLHNSIVSIAINHSSLRSRRYELESFLIMSASVSALETAFQSDPSDYALCTALGFLYARHGRTLRGRQLLSRVAHSEYNEKSTAIAIMSTMGL